MHTGAGEREGERNRERERGRVHKIWHYSCIHFNVRASVEQSLFGPSFCPRSPTFRSQPHCFGMAEMSFSPADVRSPQEPSERCWQRQGSQAGTQAKTTDAAAFWCRCVRACAGPAQNSVQNSDSQMCVLGGTSLRTPLYSDVRNLSTPHIILNRRWGGLAVAAPAFI